MVDEEEDTYLETDEINMTEYEFVSSTDRFLQTLIENQRNQQCSEHQITDQLNTYQQQQNFWTANQNIGTTSSQQLSECHTLVEETNLEWLKDWEIIFVQSKWS